MPNSTQDGILVVATSRNAAKLAAVRQAVSRFLPGARVEGLETASGVSPTPFGDDEMIAGCLNRSRQALRERPDAHYVVSLEGGLEATAHGVFVYSWATVERVTDGRRGIGCSAKVRLPEHLAASVTKGEPLAELAVRTYGRDAVTAAAGTNGAVTNGGFTRTEEFVTALACAFGYLLNDLNYQDTQRQHNC